MRLNEELISDIEKLSIYAARRVFGHNAIMSHIDSRGRLYNGCDYLEEIKQDMLLKVLEDKGGSFEKALLLSKKRFVGLVVRSARNLSINKLRDSHREVPISQVDGDFSEYFGEFD